MKKRKINLFILFLFSLVGVLVFTGCKKKDTETAVSVSIKMKTTDVNFKNTPTLEFHSGYVVIREIVFDGDLENGGSVSITHEQISKIDLATGLADPEVNVYIPAGSYRYVNLGIEIQDENDIPSVVAEGIYTDSTGQQIPVRFEFNSGEVFEANADAYTFEPGRSAIAEIDFSPAVWFSTVTTAMLDNAERVNGVILINESVNTDIFDIVADKLDDATDAQFK